MHTLTGKGQCRITGDFLEMAITDLNLEPCVRVGQVKNGGQVLHRRKQHEDMGWGEKTL